MLYIIIITIVLTLGIYIILPKIYRKVSIKINSIRLVYAIDNAFELRILRSAQRMVSSSRVTMIWEDRDKSFYKKIIKLIKRDDNFKEFQQYNYPRAFLLLGIITYIRKNGKQEDLINFKKVFDDYLKENGEPKFIINRIDQSPFGLVALHLYDVFNDEKYLKFSDNIFHYIENNIDPVTSIIDYRPKMNVVLNDMIGLTIPFLLEYANIRNNKVAQKIAAKQLDYYNKFGVDAMTQIPSHGIDKKTKAKIGSANWGRGIGWYFIGLSSYARENEYYLEYYKKLKYNMLQLQNKENLWSQFPGSSDVFDASSTLMIIYSILLNNKNFINKSQLLLSIKNYLTNDGIILQTSGDTYGLNEYSKIFGKSELSQGLLLLILSELEGK